jgi:hypothetical protein
VFKIRDFFKLEHCRTGGFPSQKARTAAEFPKSAGVLFETSMPKESRAHRAGKDRAVVVKGEKCG